MQHLHETEIDNKREPVITKDSERHVATPLHERDIERHQASMKDSE